MEAALENRFSDLELFTMFNVECVTRNGRKFDMWEVWQRRERNTPKKVAAERQQREVELSRVRKHRAEVYRMFHELKGENE